MLVKAVFLCLPSIRCVRAWLYTEVFRIGGGIAAKEKRSPGVHGVEKLGFISL